METLSQTFKAFADETRLRILNLLTGGELCVCDIMSVLKTRQPKASRHLAVLKRAGLVKARRQGTWIHHSLVGNGKGRGRLLSCLKDLARDVPLLVRDREMLRALSRKKNRCV